VCSGKTIFLARVLGAKALAGHVRVKFAKGNEGTRRGGRTRVHVFLGATLRNENTSVEERKEVEHQRKRG